MNILEWIDSVGGAKKAAAILKEEPRTVESWKYGEKIPHPKSAKNIVEKTNGKVDYNGVFAALFVLQEEKRAKALMRKEKQA